MSRYYKKEINGEAIRFPSVTTIISDCTDSSAPLMQWSANQVCQWVRENCKEDYNWGSEEKFYEVYEGELDDARFNFRKVAQKALDIGSEVHNAIELYLKGKRYVPLATEESKKAFQAFQEWEKEVDLKPIKLEQTVWGNRWAGTLDMVCWLNDKIYVVDFKTSKPKNKKTGKGIYPETRYQVAAYRSVCWISGKECGKGFNHRTDIDGCGILRLDKETGIPDWNDTSKNYEQDLRIFNRMVDLYFERHPRIRKQFNSIIPF